ncbi:hypothetical protein BDY21DRAFT_402477 [Lineolata rhizophorae]|uniref:Uncharacterized protein n=1 Tax=Lineolata rhizophorae TaxID=578093 RepID=A0A6A6NNL0_9PEZI|nr:hypothetical protein BDY21DRAFT_402477 [Lineolata rhizophorae]
MIVRESPHKRNRNSRSDSPSSDPSAWPPKSPHQALLSSPSGRRKLEQAREARLAASRSARASRERTSLSPSPSPTKRRAQRPTSATSDRLHAFTKDELEVQDGAGEHDETEEDDEETLRLQLQAIEARLRLKKLQASKKSKAARPGSSDVEDGDGRATSSSSGRISRTVGARTESSLSTTSAQGRALSAAREGPGERGAGRWVGEREQEDVQVPVSPIKRAQPPQEQTSPARVLLGIDKGLRAQDVSLKRPSRFREASEASRGDKLSRASSVRTASGGSGFGMESERQLPKVKSFSERMAESREREKERREKEEKKERRAEKRSRGFGIDGKELERYRMERDEGEDRIIRNDAKMPPPSTSKSKSTLERQEGSSLSKSRSTPNLQTSDLSSTTRSSSTLSSRPTTSTSSHTPFSNPTRYPNQPPTPYSRPNSSFDSPVSASTSASTTATDSATTIESYSGLHISKRLIPHNVLTRTFESKAMYPLPRLLKDVKAPDYSIPFSDDTTSDDFVVLGIIASKSPPRDIKTSHVSIDPATGEPPPKPKFMVLQLTDLKWEVDLYLFDAAFRAFYRLTPGTLIALLNPGIMPPRADMVSAQTGAFSLKITSGEGDELLELGRARDIDWCQATRKDGTSCPSWVDKRHTNYCEFHVNAEVARARRGRMEVNSMSGYKGSSATGSGGGGAFTVHGGGGGPGFGRGSGRGRGALGFGAGGRGGGGFRDDGLRREGQWHDRHAHETVFIAPKEFARGAGTTAALLDADEDAFARGCSREELVRRRRVEREREMEMCRKLGKAGTGGGVGGEYLRVKGGGAEEKNGEGQAGSLEETKPDVDPAALGLLGRTAGDVRLSPVKRKRGDSTQGSQQQQQPMGWGGARRAGLISETKLVSSSTRARGERKTSLVKPGERAVAGEESPKKKARFMLAEKGIREPGRESLGGAEVGKGDVWDEMGEEDDDELDIIR